MVLTYECKRQHIRSNTPLEHGRNEWCHHTCPLYPEKTKVPRAYQRICCAVCNRSFRLGRSWAESQKPVTCQEGACRMAWKRMDAEQKQEALERAKEIEDSWR